MMELRLWAACLLVALGVVVGDVRGLKHELKISDDTRAQFFVEQFSFAAGGTVDVVVKDFTVDGGALAPEELKSVGIVVQKVASAEAQAHAAGAAGHEQKSAADGCLGLLESGVAADPAASSSSSSKPATPAAAPAASGSPATTTTTTTTTLSSDTSVFTVRVGNGESRGRARLSDGAQGFYNVFFVSCLDRNRGGSAAPRAADAEAADAGGPKYTGRAPRYSFELDLTMKNPGGYLPAGETALPSLLFFFSALYAVWTAIWYLRFLRPAWANVNRMHVLITLLYVLKTFSLFFKAMDKKEINDKGRPPLDGWVVMYYIFASLKTTGLFLLIALIGTGFTFVKPFLSDRDKKIFLVVLPLQILDNVAMVVLEELAPGSTAFSTWKDIFRLVDIICCAAILAPIIWSIKHLREAAQSSGKARQSLAKLRLFRQFYLLVVSYIYFTRIIIYLLEATLPFDLTWFSQFSYEVATLGFLGATGYYFRPAADNPYFDLKDADSDDEAIQAELLAIEIDSDDAAALLQPNDEDQDKPKLKVARD